MKRALKGLLASLLVLACLGIAGGWRFAGIRLEPEYGVSISKLVTVLIL